MYFNCFLLFPAGDDYNILNGVRVIFPPGVFQQQITLTTLSDMLVEGNENLTARLTPVDPRVTVSQSTADIIIREDSQSLFVCI